MYLHYLKDTTILKDTSILRDSVKNANRMPKHQPGMTAESCLQSINAVRDTLYVLNGKWKLPIIVALSNGPKRFKDLQRSLEDVTPKILSKELKDLEMNEFVTRTVYATSPVTVEYELTAYSESLDKVIETMRDWGMAHRKRLMSKNRKKQEMPTI